MPTREEWIRAYDDLMEKLRLPCKLQFFDGMKAPGRHEFNDDGPCYILINPDSDFRVPEHLILHEGAHHRVSEAFQLRDEFTEDEWCHIGGGGHCKHWAQALCDMYRETGIALPQTTSFVEFAKAAGIVRKNFVQEGDDA